MASNVWSIRPVLSSLVFAGLAACGGGGNGDDHEADSLVLTDTGTAAVGQADTNGDGGTAAAADVVDKYVGSWRACFPNGSGSGSNSEALVITKTGANTADFTFNETQFLGAGCSGVTAGTDGGSGSVTLAGTKSVSGGTADKASLFQGGATEHSILAIGADGKLYTGSEPNQANYSADGEGYPNTFNPTGFDRQ